ncbi:MAG: MFS transporter, partial [Elusimicrobiota bacterium]
GGGGPWGAGLRRAARPAAGAGVPLGPPPRPFLRPGWGGLKAAVLAFGVAMIGFALSPHLVPACLFLALAGAADGASVIIRQTVYQARTPDALRGRVAALGGIFISASNELGAFESGVAARLMGAVPSVIFGGCAALLSVAAMDKVFEGKIRRAEPLPEPSAAGARPRDFV